MTTSPRACVSCFQCDLDIPHVCYAGMPKPRWGLGDEAMAALEGMQRHGFMLTAEQRRARTAARTAVKKQPQRAQAPGKRRSW